MTKFIDAEKLKKRIEKLDIESCISETCDGFDYGIDSVLEVIDSLQQEQSEVDLEKEMAAYIKQHFHIRYDETLEVGNAPLTTADFEEIALHFTNFGLNLRRNNKTQQEQLEPEVDFEKEWEKFENMNQSKLPATSSILDSNLI